MKCAAYMPDLNARCGLEGMPVRRACVHEHVLETVACLIHTSGTNGFCLPCFEADGHECPITVTPIRQVTP